MNGISTTTTNIPVVAFEHYMLCDEQASYSMTCHLRFWFDGCFERDRFERALQDSIKRHPLFRARIRTGLGNFRPTMVWEVLPADFRPFLSWGDYNEPLDAPPGGYHASPFGQVGVRFWVRQDVSRALLIIQFHHSVADGYGVLQFFTELMTRYDGRKEWQEKLVEIRPEVFQERGSLGLSWWGFVKRFVIDLRRIATFFKTIPSVIAGDKHGFTATADIFAAEREVLDPNVLEGLKKYARAQDCTVNDVMMSELFKTANEWNLLHARDSNQTIRLSMPVSMRSDAVQGLSAANQVSMVFLDRTSAQIKNHQTLLPSIHKETDYIKQNNLGHALIRAVHWLGTIPWILPVFLKVPICQATLVLTNLGMPFYKSHLQRVDGLVYAGGVTLTAFDTMPPVRNKTRLSLSVNYYAKKLSLTLRYDSIHLSTDAAKKFLQMFIIRLKGL
jgi:NRPS condensation-like uncharacterized protein